MPDQHRALSAALLIVPLLLPVLFARMGISVRGYVRRFALLQILAFLWYLAEKRTFQNSVMAREDLRQRPALPFMQLSLAGTAVLELLRIRWR